MKLKWKALSLFLAFAMMFSLLPSSALAVGTDDITIIDAETKSDSAGNEDLDPSFEEIQVVETDPEKTQQEETRLEEEQAEEMSSLPSTEDDLAEEIQNNAEGDSAPETAVPSVRIQYIMQDESGNTIDYSTYAADCYVREWSSTGTGSAIAAGDVITGSEGDVLKLVAVAPAGYRLISWSPAGTAYGKGADSGCMNAFRARSFTLTDAEQTVEVTFRKVAAVSVIVRLENVTATERVIARNAGTSPADNYNYTDAVDPISDNDTITFYEGDTVQFNSTVTAGAFDGIYVGDTKKNATTNGRLTAGTDFADGDVITIKSVDDSFRTVDGLAADGMTFETRGDHPWTVQQDGSVASGNAGLINSTSVLKVTAASAGSLVFDYKTSTNAAGGWLLYKNGTELTTSNYSSADNFSVKKSQFGGLMTSWATAYVDVEADDVVYFVYYKNNTTANLNDDTVWMKNFRIANGGYEVSVTSNNEDYGTANATSYYIESGSGEVTFTAVPTEGYKFYGWVQGTQFVSAEAEYTATITADYSVQAVFGAENAFEARIDGEFYVTLEDAVAAASGMSFSANNIGVIIMVGDATIESAITLPNFTALLLPYSASETTIEAANGERPYANARWVELSNTVTMPGDNVTYTLTLSGSAKLNVGAYSGLVIGGEYSCSQPMNGHVHGPHSEIVLNDGAEINVSGILSCCGYITGGGTVNVTGGTVYENFVVTDFNGGSIFVSDFGQGQFPFNSYLVMGIQSLAVFNSDAELSAYCCLTVGGTVMGVTASVLGGSGALIQLEDGSNAEMTYETNPVYVIKNNNIGITYVKVCGDAAIGSLAINVTGLGAVDTGSFECPLPYSIVIEQVEGNLDITAKIKTLPGNRLIIDENASLTLLDGASLDGKMDYSQTDRPYPYPTANNLFASGYLPVAAVEVKGTLTAADGSSLKGAICLLDGGTIEVSEYCNSTAVTMAVTEEQLDPTNPQCMMLVGQLQNGQLVPTTLDEGTTYSNDGGTIETSETVEEIGSNTIYFVGEGWPETQTSLETKTVTRHTKPTYTGETPTKASDIYYTYTFSGWIKMERSESYQLSNGELQTVVNWTQGDYYDKDAELPEVTGDAWYMVSFSTEGQPYHIYFETGSEDETETISIPSTQTVPYGTYIYAVSKYTQHTRVGYTFSYWKNKVTGNNAGSFTMPANDVTLVAVWTINTYTVTWTDDAGNVIETDTAEYGSRPSYDGEPLTKENYTFVGWQDADGNVLTEETIVTAAVTYSPIWRAVEVLTTYNFSINSATASTGGVEVGIVDSVNGVFTVSSNNDIPCVVAINNGDGTYTLINCSTTNGVHTFTCPDGFDESISIVVALKGDINRDGRVNSRDTNSLSNHNLGNTLITDSFQLFLSDVNQDNRINGRDTNALSNNNLGNTSFVW